MPCTAWASTTTVVAAKERRASPVIASVHVPDVPCWVAAFDASEVSQAPVVPFQYLLSLVRFSVNETAEGVSVPSVTVNTRRLRGVLTPAAGAATTSSVDEPGVGLAEGLGDGLGEGDGEGLGDGEGDGLGDGEGEGLGDGVGDGLGDGDGLGEGVGDGGGLETVSARILSPVPKYVAVT